MALKSINPLNGKVLKRYKEDPPALVQQKIDKAAKAFKNWSLVPFEKRAEKLTQAAQQLRLQKKALAKLMAAEMGKPLADGLAEIEKCALVCEYYAENGASFLKDMPVKSDAARSFVSFQPLGVVLAVMPWNFPFWQCFRFLAPGLMAGNTGLLKHASNVSGCALAIESILKKAGFPSGTFQTLLIGSKSVKEVISNPLVQAVTLTGSTGAGMQVAQLAGAHLKKTVLELGGSDAYLILEDADLEQAATICAQSRLINNGQSCISAKRFIVVKKVLAEFTQLLKEKMAAYTTDDPLQPHTQLGPMARKDLRDELHQQVQDSITLGAKCILGGSIPKRRGSHAFYEPTILSNVKKGMPAFDEELFGPVAAIIAARNTRHAIDLANDSVFGLGAAVFTQNNKEGERIAREELEAGACFVNALVKSDPRLPFGGIKQSGYGRELGSFGIREFVNIKTVYRGK